MTTNGTSRPTTKGQDTKGNTMTTESVDEIIADAIYDATDGDGQISPSHAAYVAITALTTSGYSIEQGWRTIDSAPRDGEKILLAIGYGRVDVGFWEDGGDGDEVGWYSATNHNGYEYAGLTPTMWRPLPASPGGA